MKLITSLFIVTAMTLVSCKDNRHQTIAEFNKIIKSDFTKEQLDSLKFIVIIPTQGCGSCITVAEDFYINQKNNTEIKYIFTNVVSKKVLKNKLKINSNTSIIDETNNYLTPYPKNRYIYPCVLQLNKGEIVALYYQSTEETGFYIISKLLNI